MWWGRLVDDLENAAQRAGLPPLAAPPRPESPARQDLNAALYRRARTNPPGPLNVVERLARHSDPEVAARALLALTRHDVDRGRPAAATGHAQCALTLLAEPGTDAETELLQVARLNAASAFAVAGDPVRAAQLLAATVRTWSQWGDLVVERLARVLTDLAQLGDPTTVVQTLRAWEKAGSSPAHHRVLDRAAPLTMPVMEVPAWSYEDLGLQARAGQLLYTHGRVLASIPLLAAGLDGSTEVAAACLQRLRWAVRRARSDHPVIARVYEALVEHLGEASEPRDAAIDWVLEGTPELVALRPDGCPTSELVAASDELRDADPGAAIELDRLILERGDDAAGAIEAALRLGRSHIDAGATSEALEIYRRGAAVAAPSGGA